MNRVKETREAKGIRREELATRAGISYDYVCRLERGANTPGLDVARAIARVLGTTVDKLWPSETPSRATVGK